MQGRYGVDELYKVLLTAFLVIAIISCFIRKPLALHYTLWGVELLIGVFAIFRIFSKNLPARRKENDAWLRFVYKVKNSYSYSKEKYACRHTHIFRSCPNCKAHIKLPKVKGAHTVECPKCHRDFSVKVR
jgi:hypothetical protein